MLNPTIDLAVPQIHINGTSRDWLIASHLEAIEACRNALALLRQTCPNGRDYYGKPGQLAVAQLQHQTRVEAIESVINDLNYLCERISES